MVSYKWYFLYKDLSELLKEFYIKNKKQNKKPGEEFYKLCTKDEFKTEFNNLFKWSKNISERSLDPFHIYASFNNSGTNLEMKRKRLSFYFKILSGHGIEDNVNDENIDNRFSVPHIAIVYVVADRPKELQEEIWNFFINIMNNDKNIQEGFEESKNWFGIGFVVITEFLFWIKSSKYLSLDKNTESLLRSHNYKSPKNYDDYMSLIKRIKYITQDNDNILRLLVEYAYTKKLPDNGEDKKDILSVLNYNKLTTSNAPDVIEEFIKFQLIGIKILDKCNDKYKKTLKKNIYYTFTNKFRIKDSNEIIYQRYNENNLFNIDNLFVNINVIVGKNGSGKSTLSELAFMIINNLTKHLYEKSINYNKNIIYIEDDLHVELLFIIKNQIYQVTTNNKEVNIKQFVQQEVNKDEVIFKKDNQYREENFNFDDLYYTEHLNYSLHSLNKNYFGEWIDKLFHKNDGYKTPITLEPYRNNGNIDINKQINLTKDRLLINLLDNDWDTRHTIIKNKVVSRVNFKINISKLITYDVISKDNFNNIVHILNSIYGLIINLNIYENGNDILNEIGKFKLIDLRDNYKKIENLFLKIDLEFLIVLYVYNKLLKITDKKYDKYIQFTKDIEEGVFINIFNYIDSNQDHLTFKIFRAIYYLKHYQKEQFHKHVFSINPLDLGSKIANIKARNKDLITDMLIPPSIYDINIDFEDNSTFDNLSSGEKQKIFTITTILYHIKNIASIEKSYKCINVVLDEIELYFHPEMQKDFINDLYYSLHSDEFIKSNINAINFIFITHSPFILSDVTHNDVIALNENGTQIKDTAYCFASNIYDLLNNSFFMESFIGGFAHEKIKFVLEILNDNDMKEEDVDEKDKLIIQSVVKNIGDNFLRTKLNEMYESKFKIDILEQMSNLDREIEELQIRKEKLLKQKIEIN